MALEQRVEYELTTLQSNDPIHTCIPFHERLSLTNSLARRLGVALQGNTYATDMWLNLCYLEAEAHLDEDSDSCALLFKFMRQSKSLTSVWFNSSEHTVDDSIVRRFYLAIAENTAIVELILSNTVHPAGFNLMMSLTKSLQILYLNQCKFDSSVPWEFVVDSLRENQTLKCLRFRGLGGTSEPDVVEQLVGASTTVEQLDLYYCLLSPNLLEPIVKCIKASKSLAKLSLCGGAFNIESMRLFQSIFKAKQDENWIRELHLRGQIDFGNQSAGDLMAEILTALPEDEPADAKAEKISFLEVLDVGMGRLIVSVCKALGANPKGIRLQCFRCGVLDNAGCISLVACLPDLVHLQRISIEDVGRDIAHGRKEKLLLGLQQNGSLLEVSIGQSFYLRSEDGEPFLSEIELSLIAAYCTRNENILDMVSNPRVAGSIMMEDATDVEIFPKVFRAATQVPRTAPTVLLTGLLVLGDSVGPKNG
jgi:hypothetical protein